VNKLQTFAKAAAKVTSEKSPTILSGIAIGGVVTTLILAVRAGAKANETLTIVNDNGDFQAERGTKEFYLETIKHTWKPFVPVGIMGLATIGCIVGANTIGNKRLAAMAGAYTLSDTAFREYKDKVVETFGEKKEDAVQAAANQATIDKNPPPAGLHSENPMDVLCLDSFSGRYFYSNRAKIDNAEIDTNYQILHTDYASLNDFYAHLNLDPTTMGEIVGWNNDKKLELKVTTGLSPDQLPCIVIGFRDTPVANYRDLWG